MQNVPRIPALCRRCGNLRTDAPTRMPLPAGAVSTYRDACKAGVAVVCADADKFGATL